MAQNDGESIGNLNYSWSQISILDMRGLENNILLVAIDPSFVSKVNKKNAITDVCMVDGRCQEIACFSSVMLRQKMQHLYQSILR